MPPQHRHFRALVDRIIGKNVNFARMDDRRAEAGLCAYACCFERSETFQFQLAQWRAEPDFRATCCRDARSELIADLLPHDGRGARAARALQPLVRMARRADSISRATTTARSRSSRWSPDDWHEIVLRWDWDLGVDELNWITAQRSCDRATARLCAVHRAPRPHRHDARPGPASPVRSRRLAARLEGGFYPNAELGLELSDAHAPRVRAGDRDGARHRREPVAAHRTTSSPIAAATHAPKYTFADGQVRYHYDHWLAHVAPRR